MKRLIYFSFVGALIFSLFPMPALASDELVTMNDVAVDDSLQDNTEPVSVSDDQHTDVNNTEPVALIEPNASDISQAPEIQPTGALAEKPEVLEEESLRPLQFSELQVDGTCASGMNTCTGSNVEFIEIYNPNDSVVQLAGWKVQRQATGASSMPQDFVTFGSIGIAAQEHVLIVFGLVEPNESIVASYTNPLSNTAGSIFLIDPEGQTVDVVGWGTAAKSFYGSAVPAPPRNQSVQRCLEDGKLSEALPRNNQTEFGIYDELGPTPGQGVQCMDPPIVNLCTGIIISEIAANTQQQFVELYNSTHSAIDLTGCRLQTNRSSSNYNFEQVVLPPDSYFVVNIVDTGLTLTKTTSGTVYLLSSDGAIEADSVYYENLAIDTSWSWFGGGDWRQTYALTGGGANIHIEFPDCEAGYERNVETGRCRKVSSETTLTPCREGQYRSEETNRCRSIASAAAAILKPCADDQFRNPSTNRCKKIASSDDPADCGEGRERNPTTNRCRNLVRSDVPAAAFAVQPVKDSTEAFVGWWALGGVGLLALGYAGWEWRRDIVRGIQATAAKVGLKK